MNIVLKTDNTILFLNDVKEVKGTLDTLIFNHADGTTTLTKSVINEANDHFCLTDEGLTEIAENLFLQKENFEYSINMILNENVVNNIYDALISEQGERLIVNIQEISSIIDEGLSEYGLRSYWELKKSGELIGSS